MHRVTEYLQDRQPHDGIWIADLALRVLAVASALGLVWLASVFILAVVS